MQTLETTRDPSAEELEVMRLLASGMKDYAVARKLGVSVVTVRRRIASFKTRLGARNRVQAVAIAAGQGLISPPKEKEPLT